jgi:hypothetical protein
MMEGARTLSHESLVAAEQIAVHATRIYEESIKEADGCDPDQIEDGDGETWWLTIGNRARAIAYYAREMGIGFTDVRCTRAYMRINRQAIREAAAALAAEDWESGEITERGYIPAAETWEGEGWLYEGCEKADPGAIAMWRCEAKRPTSEKGSDRGA